MPTTFTSSMKSPCREADSNRKSQHYKVKIGNEELLNTRPANQILINIQTCSLSGIRAFNPQTPRGQQTLSARNPIDRHGWLPVLRSHQDIRDDLPAAISPTQYMDILALP